MDTTLIVSEIFYSLQGESTHAGEPFVFIRLAGCNLSCDYCDTRFARSSKAGKPMSLEKILEKIASFAPVRKILVTGGEPLIQKNTAKLMRLLDKKGYLVLIETNGSVKISGLPKRTVVVMDVKTPSSGHVRDNDLSNIPRLKKDDELKFVISDKMDYLWMKKFVSRHSPHAKILLSPVQGKMKLNTLAEWMLHDRLDAHLQPQLHKMIGVR